MPVCVLGMHRSGTSLTARLLRVSGLYLGEDRELTPPADDNPDGFFEHLAFVNLNTELINRFGGDWDFPPDLPPGWVSRPDLAPLRRDASLLRDRFAEHGLWGWKDPRNSLTLPFWLERIPHLKLIVCVRNPLEVAISLNRRNHLSYEMALKLWETYNQSIVEAIAGQQYIVTHYEASLATPRAELSRLCAFAGLTPSTEALDQAESIASGRMRHSTYTGQHLVESGAAASIVDLYATLCDEARWEAGIERPDAATASGPTPAAGTPEAMASDTAARVPVPAAHGLRRSVFEAEQFRADIERLRETSSHHIEVAQELQQELARRDQQVQAAEERISLLQIEAGRRHAIQTALEADLATARDEAASLRGESAGLRDEAGGMRHESAVLREETESLRGESAALRAEADSLRHESAALRTESDGLRHENASLRAELASQSDSLGPRTSGLHQMLMDLHGRVLARTDELQTRSDANADLRLELIDKARAISGLEIRIAENSSRLASMQRDVRVRDSDIAKLERELEARAERDRSAQQQLDERLTAAQQQLDERLNAAQQQLDERDANVAMLRGEVNARDVQIASLSSEIHHRNLVIADLQARIQAIYDSRLWHLATAYWRVRKQGVSGLTRRDQGGFWKGLISRGSGPAADGAVRNGLADSGMPGEPRPLNAPDASRAGEHEQTSISQEAQAAATTAQPPSEPSFVERGLADLLPTYEARFGSGPVILDWTRDFDLSSYLPAGVVFAPPSSERTLPYFDASVDVVVIEAEDTQRLAEARRVAQGCIFLIHKSAPSHNGRTTDSADGYCEIEWRSEPEILPLPSVSIVIPVYNKSHLTNGCLEALLPTLSEDASVSIVVVDDGSTDNTPDLLRRWARRDSRITVVTNEENRGFIDTCNRGAAEGDSEIILFLNNDTIPQAGWLEPLLRLFRDDAAVGAAGSKLLFADGRLQEAGGVIFKDGTGWNIGRNEADAHAPLYTYLREVDYCSGAVLATRRALFEEIDGFDTRYRPAYYEDVDYCFSVRQRGLKVVYQPESTVIHLEGGTSGTDLSSDAKRYQEINRPKLVEKWRAVLADQPDAPPKPDRAGFQQVAVPPKTRRILVSAPLVPEFDREGGSRRLFHLIEYLLQDGWSVTFLAPHGPRTNRYKRILEQLGVAVYLQGEAPLVGDTYATESERVIGNGAFDVAILAFWYLAEQYHPIIQRLSPKTRVMVDSIDLHFVRQARGTFKPHAMDWERKTLDVQYADAMIRELNAYAEADLVLTVSQKEADIVNDLTGDGRKAMSVPLTDDLEPSPVKLEERQGILFLGNFRHPPNVEALEYLCREIVPRLDEQLLAAHPIWVVGTGLDDRIRQIGAGLPHVHMIGWVPVTTPYLHRARITAVPLLHGAGMKSKMVQALMAATPTVTTSVGVEGMDLVDSEHVLIANDPRAFADGVARLLKDDELWERLAAGGRSRVMEHFSRDVIRELFLEAIDAVLQDAPDPTLMLPAPT